MSPPRSLMEFDLHARVLRETYRDLLGIQDGVEADARFLAFCRGYVHVYDESYRTLHASLGSQQDPSPASPTISISSAATSKACTPATAFRTPDASTSAAAHITPQPSTSAAAAASSELNEDHMNTSLEDTSKDRIICPICKALVRSVSGDSLLLHLQNYHNPDNPDDEQTPSPPGGNEFTLHTIHTPQRPSSRATSPEPPLAMDVSLDEMAFVHVTLDENPAASPSAASPSAAGMDDKSNTSDVDLDVSQRFGEAEVRASTSAASAAAAAAVTSYLDEVELSRFTPIDGPRRRGARQSYYRR